MEFVYIFIEFYIFVVITINILVVN